MLGQAPEQFTGPTGQAVLDEASSCLADLSQWERRRERDAGDARPAGTTREEIGELIANVALNILTVYLNILTGVENDWPLVSLQLEDPDAA